MSDQDAQAKLLAAALYDVRTLLGPGSQQPDGRPDTEVAALAYGLHNEALALLEGRDFAVDEAWKRLASIDERLDTDLCRRLRFHIEIGAKLSAAQVFVRPGTAAVEAFVDTVRRFIDVVTRRAELRELQHVLAELQMRVLDLPNWSSPSGGVPGGEPGEALPLPGPMPDLLYWDVFDPCVEQPEEPVANSLADDLADIWSDLTQGLVWYEAGDREVACGHWTSMHQIHWGEHLVGALRALHLAGR